MNYTTLAWVKSVLGAEEATDDDLLAQKISEASRMIDTTLCHAPKDYFMQEDVENENVRGIISTEGIIYCWPKKAIVNSVLLFEYRLNPAQDWQLVDARNVEVVNDRQVKAWNIGNKSVGCRVRISYNGGYGTETWSTDDPPVATIEGLPEEIVEAATLLTVRLYKEEKSGLTDSIGVAELGTLQYTKAFPTRARELVAPYSRKIA